MVRERRRTPCRKSCMTNNPVGTKLELKELKGNSNTVVVTYEAAAWEGGRDGKHVSCTIEMSLRPFQQSVDTTIDFGKRTRPTIIESFDTLADQFEWMAKAIRERKCSLNQIPLFLQ
jgi:hypothetical protein